MTTPKKTLCLEAHELLVGRQDGYGDMVASWKRIAVAAGRRTGTYMEPESALWVLIEMKLERDRNSPENRDHLRDAIGYLGILAEVRAEVGPARTQGRYKLPLGLQ